MVAEDATTLLATGSKTRNCLRGVSVWGKVSRQTCRQLPECERRGGVWAGNKILYVASDTVSAAFQYEIRLDEVVAAEIEGVTRAEGAVQLDRPFHELYGGIYFPIPDILERFLVPRGGAEIRLELHCDWIDMRTAKHWTPKEAKTAGVAV